MTAQDGFARAKINLTLHVGPPRGDGRHPLESLVAFADVGDRLSLEFAPAPAGDVRTAIFVSGPFGEALPADAPLSIEAPPQALLAREGRGGRLTWRLEKHLPIASGIGGGSADAAAALHLINAAAGLGLAPQALADFSAGFGGDLPVCVIGETAMMRGAGEIVAPLRGFPALPAVLVNPNAPCPTGPVYRRFDQLGLGAAALACETPPLRSAADAIDWLRTQRNDLEAPAVDLLPDIGDVLRALARQPLTRLARMSGSGATCFALTDTRADADALAAALKARYPAWWVSPCTIC